MLATKKSRSDLGDHDLILKVIAGLKTAKFKSKSACLHVVS